MGPGVKGKTRGPVCSIARRTMNRLSSGNLAVSFSHNPHVQPVKFNAQALFSAM